MTKAPYTLGILWYPGAQAAAAYGLRDLLEAADRLHRARAAKGRALDVCSIDAAAPLRARRLTAVIIPPSLEAPCPPSPRVVAWLRARHVEGAILCSVCVGGFLLAATGLLDGRAATTHWALRDTFAARFPKVALDTDRLIVDDGDVVTAGGMMAWVDLGLRLVERFLGPTTTLDTARHFLVDPGGREQRFYQTFAPTLTHGDAAVLRAQHWVQKESAAKVTVPAMAACAHLGLRTFLRRFQAATGLTPSSYLQHVRVAKARDVLERTTDAVDSVAWRVGYEDAGAFRKVFVRLMGLSPGEYRRRFGVAGGVVAGAP